MSTASINFDLSSSLDFNSVSNFSTADSFIFSSPIICAPSTPAEIKSSNSVLTKLSTLSCNSTEGERSVYSIFGLPILCANSTNFALTLLPSANPISMALRTVSLSTILASASIILTPSESLQIKRSISEVNWSVKDGKRVISLAFRPKRTAETGPLKGNPEIISAAETAVKAVTTTSLSRSLLRTVAITWTSFLKPIGKSGRILRSIIRPKRTAVSLGPPSRFIHLPPLMTPPA